VLKLQVLLPEIFSGSALYNTMRNVGFPGAVLLVNRFQFGLSVLELKCNAGAAAHCLFVCLFV